MSHSHRRHNPHKGNVVRNPDANQQSMAYSVVPPNARAPMMSTVSAYSMFSNASRQSELAPAFPAKNRVNEAENPDDARQRYMEMDAAQANHAQLNLPQPLMKEEYKKPIKVENGGGDGFLKKNSVAVGIILVVLVIIGIVAGVAASGGGDNNKNNAGNVDNNPTSFPTFVRDISVADANALCAAENAGGANGVAICLDDEEFFRCDAGVAHLENNRVEDFDCDSGTGCFCQPGKTVNIFDPCTAQRDASICNE